MGFSYGLPLVKQSPAVREPGARYHLACCIRHVFEKSGTGQAQSDGVCKVVNGDLARLPMLDVYRHVLEEGYEITVARPVRQNGKIGRHDNDGGREFLARRKHERFHLRVKREFDLAFHFGESVAIGTEDVLLIDVVDSTIEQQQISRTRKCIFDHVHLLGNGRICRGQIAIKPKRPDRVAGDELVACVFVREQGGILINEPGRT